MENALIFKYLLFTPRCATSHFELFGALSLLTPEQRDAQLAAARDAENGTSFSDAFGMGGGSSSGSGVGGSGVLSVGSVGSAGGSTPAAISAALALLRAPVHRETKWDRNPEWVRPTYRLFTFGADAPPPGADATHAQSAENAPTMIERAIPAALRHVSDEAMTAPNMANISNHIALSATHKYIFPTRVSTIFSPCLQAKIV